MEGAGREGAKPVVDVPAAVAFEQAAFEAVRFRASLPMVSTTILLLTILLLLVVVLMPFIPVLIKDPISTSPLGDSLRLCGIIIVLLVLLGVVVVLILDNI